MADPKALDILRRYLKLEEDRPRIVAAAKRALLAHRDDEARAAWRALRQADSQIESLRRRGGQYDTARVANSVRTRILELLNAKSDKVFGLSAILRELGIEDRNAVDFALHDLVNDGMVERVGRALYRAVSDQ
jgi:hypothetical protein